MTKKRVLFLHPDLGIGGAERAIVDAAIGLKLDVSISANWLPRIIFGRFIAFCAYLRFLIATASVLLKREPFDLCIVDQISLPVPLLKLFNKKVLFYCHFPDKLLTTRESFLKSIYRSLIDYLEEFSLRFADSILVNSKFTSNVFKLAFPSLSNKSTPVLYPVPNVENLRIPGHELGTKPSKEKTKSMLKSRGIDLEGVRYFLSINRYERKKNINLALRAYRDLALSIPAEDSANLKLVHIGGHDTRVVENVEHYKELELLAKELKINDSTILLKNCSSEEKSLLIAAAEAVIYTPEGEHFGIVPVESMFLSCPVIALRSGGPMETVVSGKTGFLVDVHPRDELPQRVADVMFKLVFNGISLIVLCRLLNNPEDSALMAKNALNRATETFSFQAMTRQLVNHVEALLTCDKKNG
ncbi:Alpha-1,3-mannosyltransferase-like protein [Cichlidogyrus casuarinus]|uniref:Alpha-1,3/1,6-mannosyltransferase ALG2 n=1 Tax=Cichlidogyrus casuarinus TaxID=1844966 RepID=A0ABD2PR47_9PLAT